LRYTLPIYFKEIRILFLKTVKAGFSNIAGSLQICVEFQARKTCIVKIDFDKSKENDFFPKVFLIMLNTELYKMLPLQLKLLVRNPFMARFTRYNFM
jgi:hypothetical protein